MYQRCCLQGYKRIFDEAEAKVRWLEAMENAPLPGVDDPSALKPEELCRWAPTPSLFETHLEDGHFM